MGCYCVTGKSLVLCLIVSWPGFNIFLQSECNCKHYWANKWISEFWLSRHNDHDTITDQINMIISAKLLHTTCTTFCLFFLFFLYLHNGKWHIQKNVSVVLRSWWNSDRIEMIVDQVFCPSCFFWRTIVST